MEDKIKEILEYLKNDYYAHGEIYIEEKCKIVSKKENHQLLDYITNLQNENETLKELNVCVGCENNIDYKSRCEKAIEYIKEWQSFPHTNGSTHNELRNLLNILNGGGEE